MQIERAEYRLNMCYPECHFVIDGIDGGFTTGNKLSIRKHGYVFLGSNFSDVVEPVEIEGIEMRGMTNAPAVLWLFDRFIADTLSDRFTPGPVALD